MVNHYKKGVFLALLTAVISGIAIFYNKLIVIKGIDPLIFNLYKNGGVAIILSLIILTRLQRTKLTRLSKINWLKLILIGLVGGSIPFLLYFEGLKTVAATNANLIHKTLFFWVAAMAVPILGERLNIYQVIGYLLIAWSNLFIGGLAGFSGNRGEFMILGATILWSVENIIAKITLKQLNSSLLAWGRMFFGSLILVLIAISQNKFTLIFRPDPSYFLPISGSIILLTLYVITWYKALKFAPATLVTSILILATPITNILTAIFITRNLPQVQVLNFIVSISGVILIAIFSAGISPFQFAENFVKRYIEKR